MVKNGAEMPLFSIIDVMGLEDLPTLVKPKEMANYMIALQVKHFGQSVDLPYKVTVRNIKLLLKEFSPEEIVWAIKKGIHVSEYPFSTALVKELILQRQEDEQCVSISNYTIV